MCKKLAVDHQRSCKPQKTHEDTDSHHPTKAKINCVKSLIKKKWCELYIKIKIAHNRGGDRHKHDVHFNLQSNSHYHGLTVKLNKKKHN